MLKKIVVTQALTKFATYAARKEAKILFGTLLTIGTHKLIQKAARKYPALKIFKLRNKEIV